jgi:hypothetical protein
MMPSAARMSSMVRWRAAAGFAAGQPYRAAQTENLGFQNRAARQSEQLRDHYFNAGTREEKSQTLEALRALQSNGSLRDNFMMRDVYGPTGDKTGQDIVDLRNGQPLGTRSIDQNPNALAVKNDPNLSREQKAAKLRAMGY